MLVFFEGFKLDAGLAKQILFGKKTCIYIYIYISITSILGGSLKKLKNPWKFEKYIYIYNSNKSPCFYTLGSSK